MEEAYMAGMSDEQKRSTALTVQGAAIIAQEARAAMLTEQEQEEVNTAQVNQLLGIVQYGQFMERVNKLTLVKTLAQLKERKAYKGMVVTTPMGGVVRIETWEQLCRAFGLDRHTVDQDLLNLAAFGEAMLEAQSKMGVGYRQLRGLRGEMQKLSDTEKMEVQQLIDDAVASGDKENLLATLDELGSRNRKLAEEAKRAREEAEDARRLKGAYLDAKVKAEEELHRLKNPRSESEAEELMRTRRVALMKEQADLCHKVIGYSLALATLVQKNPILHDTPIIDGPTMEALNLEMSKTCQLVRENLMQGGYDVDFAAEFSLDPILNQPEE